jgi:hypothetical protein
LIQIIQQIRFVDSPIRVETGHVTFSTRFL